MSSLSHAGRVLVTGAARRIGRQIALDLAEAGWNVAVHYHSSGDAADELCREIAAHGGKAIALAGDLSRPGTAEQVIAEASRGLGGLTCLINNASRFDLDEVGGISEESWSGHLDTNLKAPVFLSQAFAAQLPAGEAGNIINIIDQRVWKLNPRFFSYTVSKAALWTVTRTLAQALAPRIRVNAIGPGPALPAPRMDPEDFDKAVATDHPRARHQPRGDFLSGALHPVGAGHDRADDRARRRPASGVADARCRRCARIAARQARIQRGTRP